VYDVIFYKDKNGDEPIKDYIYELARKGQTNKNDRIHAEKIIACIKALKTYGTRIGSPTVKHIDGSIWELRPLDNRIFFFYWQENNFVLLHHFVKKTQKTPPKEIEQARRNLAEFLERSKSNEKNK
jgi:phage-related protein